MTAKACGPLLFSLTVFENTCTLVFTVFNVQDFVNFAKFQQQWNVKRCFKSCRLKTVDMNSKPLWSQPIENKFTASAPKITLDEPTAHLQTQLKGR